MDGKPWYTSKTIWFGVIYGLVSIAGVIGFKTYQPDQNTTEIVGVLTSVAIIVLRMLTEQPVKK